jgi:hypothetical protein
MPVTSLAELRTVMYCHYIQSKVFWDKMLCTVTAVRHSDQRPFSPSLSIHNQQTELYARAMVNKGKDIVVAVLN